MYQISIKLLSPLFNYHTVTNGGTSTSHFIGDIALNYALNRVLKQKNFYAELGIKKKPDYSELRQLDYFFSVGKPININLTGNYTRNTLFNVDGGPDYDVLGPNARFPTGKTLFKNYFKVQGIKAESTFSCYLFTRDDFKIEFPITVRVGTGRETLSLLELIDDTKNTDNEIWLNAFFIKTVFGELVFRNFLKKIINYHLDFDYELENYSLIKKLNVEQVKFLFKEYFDD
jgi:CRISPR-associated protein Csc1